MQYPDPTSLVNSITDSNWLKSFIENIQMRWISVTFSLYTSHYFTKKKSVIKKFQIKFFFHKVFIDVIQNVIILYSKNKRKQTMTYKIQSPETIDITSYEQKAVGWFQDTKRSEPGRVTTNQAGNRREKDCPTGILCITNGYQSSSPSLTLWEKGTNPEGYP